MAARNPGDEECPQDFAQPFFSRSFFFLVTHGGGTTRSLLLPQRLVDGDFVFLVTRLYELKVYLPYFLTLSLSNMFTLQIRHMF